MKLNYRPATLGVFSVRTRRRAEKSFPGPMRCFPLLGSLPDRKTVLNDTGDIVWMKLKPICVCVRPASAV